jgi:gamma-glutamyltranspeptidase/glutathione hydrolase
MSGRAGVAVGLLVALASAESAAAAVPANPDTRPPSVYPPVTELVPHVATSRFGMVVTNRAEASAAGARVLEAGGNAVDAAVAAALTLGSAEAGSSGIGGQSCLLIRLANGHTAAIDGSVTAPLRTSRDELQQLRDWDVLWGHKLAATPGTPAALALALERYGTRPLAELLAPAIEAAEFGVVFSAQQLGYLEKYTYKLRGAPYLNALLFNDGYDLRDASYRYCFPDLAATLRRIAALGLRDFYVGGIAARIDADMAANDGYLRRDDLARYRAIERQALRGSYRGYEVLSFPSPGGGARTLAALHILERFPAERLRADGPDRAHLLLESVRLAAAASGELDSLRSSDALLFDPARIGALAARIRLDRALTAAEVAGRERPVRGEGHTTQVSVVDRWGNAVSLTQSVGRTFGGKAAAPDLGFPYNGLLENYDYLDPSDPEYLVPGKRPLTPIAPTIVVRDGRPWLVIGTPGTEQIPGSIASVVVNLVDRGMTLAQAVAEARPLWGRHDDYAMSLELYTPADEANGQALLDRGFPQPFVVRLPARVIDVAAFGAVNAVLLDQATGEMTGVGDPRRQAIAVGAGR